MTVIRRSCLAILLSLPFAVVGQTWTFVRMQEVPQPITSIHVGVLDNVYVGTDRGNIYSFLADGTRDTELSSAIFQPVTAIDASNTLRVFVFYKDINTFEYVERFSAFPRSYSFADFGIMDADYAFPGINNSLWVISGNELMQLNPLNRLVVFKVSLGQVISQVAGLHVKERILLADAQGIKDFSMSGHLISEVMAQKIRSIQVEDASVLAVCSEGLLRWNRLTTLSSVIKLPGDYAMVAKAGEYYHFVKDSKMYTYQLQE